MRRTFSPYRFHARSALLDWPALGRSQNIPPDRHGRPSCLQLRWMVHPELGLAPRPFTVWRRRGKDAPVPVDPTAVTVDGRQAWRLPEVAVTVEVGLADLSPGSTVTVTGYSGAPAPETLAAVGSSPVAGDGTATVTVRASGLRYVATGSGRVVSVAAASVRAALDEDWDPLETVGLPVDDGWSSTGYARDDQGLVDAPVVPTDAAVQRLERGLPPFGWRAVTAAGDTVDPWQPPDPGTYVELARHLVLDRARGLFAPGLPADQQAAVRPVLSTAPPESATGTASGDATTTVPLLGTLLVGPGNDGTAALALGFGSAYPVEGDGRTPGVGGSDLLVTATYPGGPDGRGEDVEFAVVLPWTGQRYGAPGTPQHVTTERAGLLVPGSPTAPWTETVRVAFDHVGSTLALERPTVGAIAVADGGGGAAVRLDRDDAGGWLPRLLTTRPAPHQDRVALTDDVDTTLPVDRSDRTLGYAVAVADVFGLWSPWAGADHTSVAPPYPVPQLVEVRLDPTWDPATQTARTAATVDLVVDWGTRRPATVELRLALCPVAYAGAALPAGVSAWSTPAGSTAVTVALSTNGDELVPSGGWSVVYLTPDATRTVSPTDPAFPANTSAPPAQSRRYRLTLPDLAPDYGVSAHWALAGWAREHTTVPGAPWGGFAPRPVTGYAASPVPLVVSFPAPPEVPLGSLPDHDGHSHVTVRTGGITGAVTTSVWRVDETRVWTEAATVGAAPARPPAAAPLPTRYQRLQQAYDALPTARRRAAFTRIETRPGSPDGVDVALPRGHREISLFAVTAVNAGGVESAWPATHTGLQAAAAPTTVVPTVPDVSAVLDPGGATMTVTVTSRCRLPLRAVEVHATRLAAAAADIGSMGPPLLVRTSPPAGPDDGRAPGPATTVVFAAVPVTADWRPLRLRAVAAALEHDNASGAFGGRSGASPVALVDTPPATPPDLSTPVVSGWADPDGVHVAWTSAAPLADGLGGQHVLAVTARDAAAGPADPPLWRATGALAALAVDPAVPPAGSAAGVLLRGVRTGGVSSYDAWFRRPSTATAVEVEVVLRDPLGRVSVRHASVPAGLIRPPTITVLGSWVSFAFLVVEFTTDAPDDDGSGPSVLTVTGSRTRLLFPPVRDLPVRAVPVGEVPLPGGRREPPLLPWPPRPVTATIALRDVRNGDTDPLRDLPVDVVWFEGPDHRTALRAAVRLRPPASVVLTVTTAGGQRASARVGFPG